MAPGRAGAEPASLGWTAQLRDALGRVYYNHGLFCASNPMLVLAIVVIGMVWWRSYWRLDLILYGR